jgi:23S rRNA pseudouridine2604 synthase
MEQRRNNAPKKAPAGSQEPAPSYPMRLNRYLALKGIATRREADVLIEKKKVLVNGRVASLGDKVLETDTVTIRGATRPKAYAYVAFHKPAGMDTHREPGRDGEKAPNVQDALPADLARLGLFPVGRLDKASSGLLLLTNDGRITDRLLNPAHAHEKMYEVTTKAPLRASTKEKLEGGVDIEGYRTKPARVEVLGESRFRIALTEGKSHQIRRMMVALFNEVKTLKRVSIMGIRLGPLKAGGYRPIEGKELAKFLSDLGLGGEAS